MKIEPALDPKATCARLVALTKQCDSFSWASAWVTDNPAFRAALVARNKLLHLVVGTSRYITSVECLASCVDIPQAKVVAPDAQPLFHPKVYAFRSADSLIVYLGSSNLTGAGLSRNVECGVFLTAKQGDPAVECLFAFVAQQHKAAELLDGAFVRSYAANRQRVKQAKAELRTFVRLKKPALDSPSARAIDPTRMSWREFVEACEDSEYGPDVRLPVLAAARRLFSLGQTFAEMTLAERCALAGLVKTDQEGLNWFLFGNMGVHGTYHALVARYSRPLAAALDEIPLRDSVRRRHYNAFLARLAELPGSTRVGRGLATRLLAMKRPDQFVVLCEGNAAGLCGQFGVAPTTTNLGNYWERIVLPMRQMPWWLAKMPSDRRQQELWMGRANMLDAIYYVPRGT